LGIAGVWEYEGIGSRDCVGIGSRDCMDKGGAGSRGCLGGGGAGRRREWETKGGKEGRVVSKVGRRNRCSRSLLLSGWLESELMGKSDVEGERERDDEAGEEGVG
jgi:hypothetical protein